MYHVFSGASKASMAAVDGSVVSFPCLRTARTVCISNRWMPTQQVLRYTHIVYKGIARFHFEYNFFHPSLSLSQFGGGKKIGVTVANTVREHSHFAACYSPYKSFWVHASSVFYVRINLTINKLNWAQLFKHLRFHTTIISMTMMMAAATTMARWNEHRL